MLCNPRKVLSSPHQLRTNCAEKPTSEIGKSDSLQLGHTQGVLVELILKKDASFALGANYGDF